MRRSNTFGKLFSRLTSLFCHLWWRLGSDARFAHTQINGWTPYFGRHWPKYKDWGLISSFFWWLTSTCQSSESASSELWWGRIWNYEICLGHRDASLETSGKLSPSTLSMHQKRISLLRFCCRPPSPPSPEWVDFQAWLSSDVDSLKRPFLQRAQSEVPELEIRYLWGHFIRLREEQVAPVWKGWISF